MSIYGHPYYPQDIYLENYIPQTWSTTSLVLSFGLLQFLVLGPFLYYVTYKLNWSRARVSEFSWFVSCTFTHIFFEGYFVYYHKVMASKTDLFGELWKEYAKCDSRYLTQDPAVLFIESLTAILVGPACLMICILMLKGSLNYHILVIPVSVGQLYGSIIYFATTIWVGFPHSDPSPYYRYFYFYFFNSFWFIIPIILIWRSSKFIDDNLSSKSSPDSKTKKLS